VVVAQSVVGFRDGGGELLGDDRLGSGAAVARLIVEGVAGGAGEDDEGFVGVFHDETVALGAHGAAFGEDADADLVIYVALLEAVAVVVLVVGVAGHHERVGAERGRGGGVLAGETEREGDAVLARRGDAGDEGVIGRAGEGLAGVGRAIELEGDAGDGGVEIEPAAVAGGFAGRQGVVEAEVAERLVGAAVGPVEVAARAGHGLGGEVGGTFVVALGEEAADLGEAFIGLGAVGVGLRTAGPEGDVVELQALLGRATEDHGAHEDHVLIDERHARVGIRQRDLTVDAEGLVERSCSGIERNQFFQGRKENAGSMCRVAGPVGDSPKGCETGGKRITPDFLSRLRFECDDAVSRRHVHHAIHHDGCHLIEDLGRESGRGIDVAGGRL